MNKYTRAMIEVPCGLIKIMLNKIMRPKNFHISGICAMSPLSEITLDRYGKLNIGKNFKMRDGAKIRVRPEARCTIGDNITLNSNCTIVCHTEITIGEGTMFGPNVLIYDHDHDFRQPGGIWDKKYVTSPIIIGNNCWIGAGTIILRGTTIEDNCVIGAGCILKGHYSKGSLIIQKRETTVVGE